MQDVNQAQCPNCKHLFAPGYDFTAFMNHIKGCKKKRKGIVQEAPDLVYEKIPVDGTMTNFRWQKKPKLQPSPHLMNMGIADVRKLSFQQKQYWLRNNLQKLRIPWTSGADFMKIDKNNILMGSLVESQKVDMHKQVKIQFVGEKVNDAGGLLREWVHMVVKEIFEFNTGLFSIANTDDIMYKLKWDEDTDEYFSESLLILFGIILGKSIFERIPLTCFLDRTILRQICNGAVKIEDIYGYDTELYKNWKFLMETDSVEDLETYFVTYHNNGGTLKEIELLEGHKEVKVDNDNKYLYIDLCIQMHTSIKVMRSLKFIRTGIERIFPCEWLSVFEPYEMEMLLYGIPFIDIQDWHDNTEYKSPLSEAHYLIKWFWDILEQFEQDQLARILHFCTGSTRTPIHGFKRLESNRGNYSKFLIVSIPYEKKNPYPKGHTCFNRLELPAYPNRQTLFMYLKAISTNELDGVFGLD